VLSGVHILLSYACTFECDHCFLHCSPGAGGTFSFAQIKKLLEQTKQVESVKMIFFEGGEPFLFFPLLLHSAQLASSMGYDIGIVTNGYWATTEADAELWLKPFSDLGITALSISEDDFHNPDGTESPASRALAAARKLGLPVGSICIEPPTIRLPASDAKDKGEPIVGGDVRFRGRAADKLTAGLPTRSWREFTKCPDEDLTSQSRVHIDAYGYVHICQGLCMGNIWQTPLKEMLDSYCPESHPVCGPLARGGPAALAEELSVDHEEKYVDACHFCYLVRRGLIEKFPEHLAPRQVFGL
jgi:hypothetical protein